jgi:hypothetical protein
MFKVARRAVCVDFMSTEVDFRKPGSWHTDPCWALREAYKLSRRVMLRQDYMPYEFSIIIFKDADISSRNVFAAFERELNEPAA